MLTIIITILILGVALFSLSFLLRRRAGIPMGNVIYSDSERQPGQIFIAKNVPLSGKPDYLVKKGDHIIPVELKRGKTPSSPYASHIAQLYAYCYLVKDTYGVRPDYGIIDYPDNDFKLEFTQGAEENVERLVREVLAKKQDNVSRSGIKNRCKRCREEHVDF